jgi:hypothetical protein
MALLTVVLTAPLSVPCAWLRYAKTELELGFDQIGNPPEWWAGGFRGLSANTTRTAQRDGTLPTGDDDGDGSTDVGGSMSVGMSMSLAMLSAGSLSASSGSVIKQAVGTQNKVCGWVGGGGWEVGVCVGGG